MKSAIKHFFLATKKYPKKFFVCILLILFLSILEAIVPFSLKYFLDYIAIEFSAYNIVLFLLALITYSFILIGVKILWYRSLDDFGGEFLLDVLLKCEEKISYAMDYYDIEKEKNSKMKHTLYVDLFNTFTAIGHHLPTIISSLLIVSSLLIWSFFINWILSLILFASFVIGIIISYISKNHIFNCSKMTNISLKKINNITTEFIDNIEVVKANDIYKYYKTKTRNSIGDFIRVAKNEDTKTYFWSGIADGYNSIIMYVVSILLVIPFFNNSFANLALYSIVCSMILKESQIIENNIRLIIKSEICFKNVDSYLDIIEEEKNTISHICSIEFKNFSLSFDDKKIVENVNFLLSKGTINLLKGNNGTGKTTIIRSLIGVFNNYEGEIIVNNSERCANIVNNTLYIGQNGKLINGTVLDYLEIISKSKLDSSEIVNILKILGLEETFLHKIIENCGENLSNGEKKKIQLIRLLLMKDKVDLLLLDEISAGLDQEAREKYYVLLEKMKKENKIIVVIEHDKECNLRFDSIIEMK